MQRGTLIALGLLKQSVDLSALGARVGGAAKNVVGGGARLTRGVAKGLGASEGAQELAGILGGVGTIGAGAAVADAAHTRTRAAYYRAKAKMRGGYAPEMGY